MLLPQPPVAPILHRSLSAFDSAQSIMFEKHSGSLLLLQGDITSFSDKTTYGILHASNTNLTRTSFVIKLLCFQLR